MNRGLLIFSFVIGVVVGSITTFTLTAQQTYPTYQEDTSITLSRIESKIDRLLSEHQRILDELHNIRVRIK